MTLSNELDGFTAQNHRVISPFVYEGPVVKAIHRLKYNGRPELAQSLGRRLATEVLLLARISQDCVIVPVPSTPSRIVERGYNQSALLASALSRKAKMSYFPTALERVHSAPHQVGADKAQRASQVAGAFRTNRRYTSKADVILVDDVVTTGATSAACAEALKAVGARLIAVVAVARVL